MDAELTALVVNSPAVYGSVSIAMNASMHCKPAARSRRRLRGSKAEGSEDDEEDAPANADDRTSDYESGDEKPKEPAAAAAATPGATAAMPDAPASETIAISGAQTEFSAATAMLWPKSPAKPVAAQKPVASAASATPVMSTSSPMDASASPARVLITVKPE